MKTVFVTGANGHVGCNTVRELLAQGYAVRALVRPTSDLRGLEGLNVDIRYGDVIDKTSLAAAAQGCEGIVHLAANFKFFAKTAEEIMAPAVQGTRNLFEVAAESGVERIIYTSSFMAVGCTDDPNRLMTTDDWISDTKSVYSIAKRDSEKIAWELSDKYNIPLITLLPGSILGRYDYRITPSNRIIVDMMKGLGLTLEMNIPFVDVRDVAKIHALAVEKGEAGQRYFICSEAFPMKKLGDTFYSRTGKKVPHLPTSRPLNLMTGSIMETIGKWTGWVPPMTRASAEYFSHRYGNCDISKTVEDFDYQPIPMEETVEDTINWFKFLGIGKTSSKAFAPFLAEPEWVK